MISKRTWQKYGTLIIFFLFLVLFSVLSPEYFLPLPNLMQIFLQSTINVLGALGEFFAILIAGIDLSVGSILALTGLVTAKLMVLGLPVWLSILLGTFILGALLGGINGFLVNKTGLHPFVITLGTMSIFRGLALVVSNARPVYGLPKDFISSVAGTVLGIPIPIIITIAVAFLLFFLTKYTLFGRNLYAIGGNKEAAGFSGIRVNMHIFLVFVISGIAAGLAGLVTIARLGAAEPLAGTGFELFAIAAAIIGGTSFFGGIGKISGVVLGGLIIGVINNGLNILTVPTFYQQVVMGLLIIIAVFVDQSLQKRK